MDKIYKSYNLEESLRSKSYPYYFCLLTLPRSKREALSLLWGIAAEIRFIPLSVTNPLAGFMRLTSWRDRLLTAGLDEMIEWLNCYEVFFDDTITLQHGWPNYIYPEALLFQQSLFILQKDPNIELVKAATLLGNVLGLIYLLQSEQKFGFATDNDFKHQLAEEIKNHLLQFNSIYPLPKSCRGLFSLSGYCTVWLQHYCIQYQPVTLTEPVIQWSILKQRAKSCINHIIKWNFI